ncbi:hypothetical protein NDU88_004924, partial [Pleurodeles waltl]
CDPENGAVQSASPIGAARGHRQLGSHCLAAARCHKQPGSHCSKSDTWHTMRGKMKLILSLLLMTWLKGGPSTCLECDLQACRQTP